jgi:HK97 family phage major capsid protein
MEKKELLEALAEHGNAIELKNQEIKSAVETAKAESKAEVDKLKADLAWMEETRKEMQKQLNELDITIQKAKKEPGEKVKTFVSDLREQLTKEAANLKGMTERKVKEMQLEIKSFLETANASITTGSLIPTPQFEAGITKAPDRMPFILDIISTGVANALTIYWVERKTRTDNSGFVTEGTLTTVGGGAVTESVLGYNTSSASLQNIAECIKVSNNSIDDVEWLLSEIQTELLTLMALKLDAALLTGTVAVNGFDGVLTVATAFNGGGLTTTEPNIVDVLVAASNQIEVALQPEPTYAFLHPTVVNQLKMIKVSTTDNRYVDRLSMVAGTLMLDGVIRIVKTTLLTTDQFLFGNFGPAGFAVLYEKGGITMDIGVENDDFTRNLRTILAEWRGASLVPTNKRTAFVKGSIATAKALIETT